MDAERLWKDFPQAIRRGKERDAADKVMVVLGQDSEFPTKVRSTTVR